MYIRYTDGSSAYDCSCNDGLTDCSGGTTCRAKTPSAPYSSDAECYTPAPERTLTGWFCNGNSIYERYSDGSADFSCTCGSNSGDCSGGTGATGCRSKSPPPGYNSDAECYVPAGSTHEVLIQSRILNLPPLISGPDVARAQLLVASDDGTGFTATGDFGIDFRTGYEPGEAQYFASPSPYTYKSVWLPADGSWVDAGTYETQVANNTGTCLTGINGRVFARPRFTWSGSNYTSSIYYTDTYTNTVNIGAMIGILKIRRSNGTDANGASAYLSPADYNPGGGNLTADSFGQVAGIHRLNCSNSHVITASLGGETGSISLPAQSGSTPNTICNGQSRDFTINLAPPAASCACTYPQNCTVGGVAGVQTCNGVWSGSICVWDSSGGCLPNCTTCSTNAPTGTPIPTPTTTSPQPTPTPIPGLCGGSGQPSCCNSSLVNMGVNPANVTSGSNITFTVSGSQGSTYLDDFWSGGVNCSGGFWGSKVCTTGSATTQNYTWTHAWRNCAPNNCSIYYPPANYGPCSKPASFTVTTPTPTATPTTTVTPPLAPIVSPPVCIPPNYSGSGITISWTNSATPVSWVDISPVSDFSIAFNKYVLGSSSTTAPSGFAAAWGGASGLLILQPNTNYYTRIYNGTHSPTTSFNIPACATATPTPIGSPAWMKVSGDVHSNQRGL
ncbi:MAG: hypothetical protein V1808_04905 [Candidatus Daviesbacteria bacterium]